MKVDISIGPVVPNMSDDSIEALDVVLDLTDFDFSLPRRGSRERSKSSGAILEQRRSSSSTSALLTASPAANMETTANVSNSVVAMLNKDKVECEAFRTSTSNTSRQVTSEPVILSMVNSTVAVRRSSKSSDSQDAANRLSLLLVSESSEVNAPEAIPTTRPEDSLPPTPYTDVHPETTPKGFGSSFQFPSDAQPLERRSSLCNSQTTLPPEPMLSPSSSPLFGPEMDMNDAILRRISLVAAPASREHVIEDDYNESSSTPTMRHGHKAVEGIIIDDQVLYHPPNAASAAITAFRCEASVVAPIRILRAGCTDELDAIENGFVGATLCGCISIIRALHRTTTGRSWEGVWKFGDQSTSVHIFTYGCKDSVELDQETGEPKIVSPYPSEEFASEYERRARSQAFQLLHPWFPTVSDHIGGTHARLCYGQVEVHRPYGAAVVGSIFFVCGQLCRGGNLLQYQLHETPFCESTAKRIFGQLIRYLLALKKSGERSNEGNDDDINTFVAKHDQSDGGYHRSLSFESIVLSGSYDCKLLDCATLRFSDSPEYSPSVKLDIDELVIDPPKFDSHSQFENCSASSVWSAGAILLFMVAGDHLYDKLGNEVYRFFKFALQERNPEWSLRSDALREWRRQRATMGYDNIFYDTESDWGRPVNVDATGIPIIARVEGVPRYTRFWKYMGSCDPDSRRIDRDSRQALSADLKDLLCRMLDIDPMQRITLEKIVKHPWLQSHQAMDMTIPSQVWETETQQSDFKLDMHTRALRQSKSDRDHVFPIFSTFDEATNIISMCSTTLGRGYRCEAHRSRRESAEIAARTSCGRPPRSLSVPVGNRTVENRRLGTVTVLQQKLVQDANGLDFSSVERWWTTQVDRDNEDLGQWEAMFKIEVYFGYWRASWEANSVCATLNEWVSFIHEVGEHVKLVQTD